MFRFRLALALLLLAACARESAPRDPLIQHRPDWAALNDSLPVEPAAQAHVLESYRRQYGFPMTFLAGPDSAAVNQLPVVLRDHPCGTAIPAFVERIPRKHSVLATETALEVDSTGRELMRWDLPLDVTVLGVSGEELLVSLGRIPGDVYFRIKPDGSFIISNGDAPGPPVWPQRVCPTNPEFTDLRCEEFRDGRRRRLILHPTLCD